MTEGHLTQGSTPGISELFLKNRRVYKAKPEGKRKVGYSHPGRKGVCVGWVVELPIIGLAKVESCRRE